MHACHHSKCLSDWQARAQDLGPSNGTLPCVKHGLGTRARPGLQTDMKRWWLGRQSALVSKIDSEVCACCHAAGGKVAWRSVQELAQVERQRVLSYLNRSLTAASLAPMYLFRTSGPFTLMQRKPQAATAAATRCVLPHPGGPYSSRPVRRRRGALHHAMSCIDLLQTAQTIHCPALLSHGHFLQPIPAGAFQP